MSFNRILGIISLLIIAGAILANGVIQQKKLSITNKQSTQVSSATWENDKTDPKAKSLTEVKAMLEDRLAGLVVTDIEKSPIEGYYQVFFDNEMLYVSNDGRFLFTGTMLEIDGEYPVNHTQLALVAADKKRAPLRAKLISAVDESDMVIFKSAKEKHVITVFTDVDCAYCRKLHKEIPQLNNKGVTVRYMAYPRAGIGSGAYKKLVSVWCAKDKNAAMNKAKLERKFGKDSCDSPVANQFNMVRKLSLSGTPAVITESGEVIGGYLSATDMIGLLDAQKAFEAQAGQ